jgi:anti-anti-sigma factor
MSAGGIVVYGEERGVAVVVLAGEQEAYTAPALERRLTRLLDDGTAVVVDLSRATFVDSANLLVLMKARDTAAERGLGLVLQMDESTGEYVRRTFDLTRLTSVLPIFATRAEAIAAARAAGPESQLGTEPT